MDFRLTISADVSHPACPIAPQGALCLSLMALRMATSHGNNPMSVPKEILSLVERFGDNLEAHLSSQ
jgi:hypothetical protein